MPRACLPCRLQSELDQAKAEDQQVDVQLEKLRGRLQQLRDDKGRVDSAGRSLQEQLHSLQSSTGDNVSAWHLAGAAGGRGRVYLLVKLLQAMLQLDDVDWP